jgi:hypothetical protein
MLEKFNWKIKQYRGWCHDTQHDDTSITTLSIKTVSIMTLSIKTALRHSA